MILETIRAVADGLANVTYGVNAQLQTIQKDGSDATPQNVVGVYDETRSDEVAVGRYPKAYPHLTVTLDGAVDLQGEVVSGNRDAEVTVLIRYVQKNVDSSMGRTDAYYTMRAVQKALKTFFSNAQAADRNRNNIQIIECQGFEHIQMFDNVDDAMVTSGIRVTMFVRDAQP